MQDKQTRRNRGLPRLLRMLCDSKEDNFGIPAMVRHPSSSGHIIVPDHLCMFSNKICVISIMVVCETNS